MIRKKRHKVAALLVLAFVLGLSPSYYKEAQAATPKPTKTVELSTKSMKLTVGQSKTLKMLNSKKKVKWSVKSGKKVVKLKNKKKTKVTIVAKKAGTAKVVGKIGKKSYTCTVKVSKKKAVPDKPEDPEKPEASEVALFTDMINDQIKRGADLSDVAPGTEGFENLYSVDNEGHITDLWLSKLVGSVSLASFPKLETIRYEEPSGTTALISELDLSKNTALKEVTLDHINVPTIDVGSANNLAGFSADFCKIGSLRIGGKKTLGSLNLRDTNIGNELDLKDYTALVVVTTGRYNRFDETSPGSVINSIDLTGCTALTQIYVNDSKLTSLTLTGCTELSVIECCNNSISSLTLSGLTSLTEIYAYDNGMSSLTINDPELGTCPNLYKLYVSGNNFKYLDLRGTKAKDLVTDAADDSFVIIYPEDN